mmetsp:Transcript_22349/g.39827  ORF Transcript_22349/g.39827 Transcript_22349/m.39827 type:complete len:122 (-) Transcript_22349:344-709(-)
MRAQIVSEALPKQNQLPPSPAAFGIRPIRVDGLLQSVLALTQAVFMLLGQFAEEVLVLKQLPCKQGFLDSVTLIRSMFPPLQSSMLSLQLLIKAGCPTSSLGHCSFSLRFADAYMELSGPP